MNHRVHNDLKASFNVWCLFFSLRTHKKLQMFGIYCYEGRNIYGSDKLFLCKNAWMWASAALDQWGLGLVMLNGYIVFVLVFQLIKSELHLTSQLNLWANRPN